MRYWLKYTLFGFIFFTLLGLLLAGWTIYQSFFKPILNEDKPLILTIDKNTTANGFVRLLHSKGYIYSERLFLSYIKYKNLAHLLKAGIYSIDPGETPLQFLNKVIAGKVLVSSFRIIEGTTLNQVKINLMQAPFLKYNQDDWAFIKNDYDSPEGLLLADTYYYNAGTDAKPLLLLARKNLMEFLNKCWETRSSNIPYQSPYELLVVASILEKETSLPQERALISGVIVNRLKKNMPLQMDPTVIYALGSQYQGKLQHQDLKINSPYNTYIHRGLPPTPIAMVGKASIEAAAHPQVSSYLYFVAKGDGSHIFSVKYEDQMRAILRYQIKGPS